MATIDETGRPHLVPIVYAYTGDQIYTPLDHKIKQVQPLKLRRVRNIKANPDVGVIVDDYAEDWSTLAWVQVRGIAEILDGGAAHLNGVELLTEKYPQYAHAPIQERPIIAITPEKITSWRAVG
jgi:PPOX class probable F420-dependent enzyme